MTTHQTSVRLNTFVTVALVAFGLIGVSFVIMGFSRIVLPYRTARLLAGPTTAVAALLIAFLFTYSVLVAMGVRDLER